MRLSILLVFVFVMVQYSPTIGQAMTKLQPPFAHGVASGDPLSDQVIIWTRISTDEEEAYVRWHLASDPNMENLTHKGDLTTNASRDFTIKVDVYDLQPNTTYYYQFIYNDEKSIVGRTKTAPKGDVDHLKFAVVSCSNYQHGYFNAYSRIAEQNDIEAVIHLGDYIYEYKDGDFGKKEIIKVRPLEPENEIVTLEDYRQRYALYRQDPDLVNVHQQHPFICIWDDHETANDSHTEGAQNHNPKTEGDWKDRMNAGRKAYFEWMPIRDHDEQRIYRKFQYGSMAELLMLDTRLEGRDPQPKSVKADDFYSSDRTMLGQAQKDWLFDGLKTSKAHWTLMCQQVVFSDFNIGWASPLAPKKAESFMLDMWDGYPAERDSIIRFIGNNELDNVVILTGDFHASYAFEVAEDPTSKQSNYRQTGQGAVAVEFASPSITSANFDEFIGKGLARKTEKCINEPCRGLPFLSLRNPNPHLKYVDLLQHGYFILDLTKEKAQADYYYVDILNKNSEVKFGASWFTNSGESHLQEGKISKPKIQQAKPAPSSF